MKLNVYARDVKLVDGCCLEIEAKDAFGRKYTLHIWKDGRAWNKLKNLIQNTEKEAERND